MKKFFGLVPLGVLALLGGSLVACGDDSGPSYFKMDDDFEVILNRSYYTYSAKDSTLIVKQPVCKAVSVGKSLSWKAAKQADGDTMKAYANGGSAMILYPKATSWTKFVYDGSKFPRGLLTYPNAYSEVIQNGIRVDKKELKEVFRFDGSCFAKSFVGQFQKGNSAIAEADSALLKFYKMFQKHPEADVQIEKVRDDISAPNCSEINLYDGLVQISLVHFNASSGTLKLTYKKKSTEVKFEIRYAYDKSGCEAAFADYEADDEAPDSFRFEDYWKKVTYDIYEIKDLVLAMQKDNKVLSKKSVSKSADELTRAAVDFVFAGMKL